MSNNDDEISRLRAELNELKAQLTANTYGTEDSAQVSAYHQPKIPAFMRSNPIAWFAQAKITMRNAGITASPTKADFVGEKLDADALMCVIELLNLTPRLNDLYEKIKSCILASFSGSEGECLRQLLRGQVSNEGKPTLILNRLRALETGCENELIKQIFLEQMTPNCRAALAISNITNLDKLAATADKYAESLASENPHIAASSIETSALIQKWKAELKWLSDKIDRIELSQVNSRRRARSNSRNRSS